MFLLKVRLGFVFYYLIKFICFIDLGPETMIIHFNLHMSDRIQDPFIVSLNSIIPRAKIYNQIIEFVQQLDQHEFAIQMFGKTFCIDKEMTIEVSSDLSECFIVYIDTVRIRIEPIALNDIKIVPLSKVFIILFLFLILTNLFFF